MPMTIGTDRPSQASPNIASRVNHLGPKTLRATIVLGVLTAISTLWLFIIASEVQGHCRELGCLEVIAYSLPAWAGVLMIALGLGPRLLRQVRPDSKSPGTVLVVAWILLVCLVLAADGFMLVSYYGG